MAKENRDFSKYLPEDITALSFGEHVRLRPQLYFQNCFEKQNINDLIFESLCHAFDEFLEGNCKNIHITLHQNNSFTIKYDAGLSLEKLKQENLTHAEVIMTQLRACSNHKKHLSVGDEFCEIGMATINMISNQCILSTIHKNIKGEFLFRDGETISKTLTFTTALYERTIITFVPNKKIFNNLGFSIERILESKNKIKERFPNLNVIIQTDFDIETPKDEN